jgi:hypothetical protein
MASELTAEDDLIALIESVDSDVFVRILASIDISFPQYLVDAGNAAIAMKRVLSMKPIETRNYLELVVSTTKIIVNADKKIRSKGLASSQPAHGQKTKISLVAASPEFSDLQQTQQVILENSV